MFSLAPTLLDIWGLENTRNYFPGNSLFTEEISEHQYIRAIADKFYSTKNYEKGVSDIARDANFNRILEELKYSEKISLGH